MQFTDVEERGRTRGRATITDVAALSGTSIKTVSRVFNDEPFVRPATRKRVLDAAAQLDYHPNMAARSLVRGRSFLIGLFYENPSPNYVVDLQTGALDRLHDERFQLLLFPCESAANMSGRLLGIARASGLEGLILAPPLGDDAATVEELTQARFPFVRIAPTTAPTASPAVGIDDIAAAREMTRHLLDLGHRRIAFVQGDPNHPSNTQRLAGFREALAERRIVHDEALLDGGLYTFESGVAAGRRIFAAATRPTAVFAANDDMAAGVLLAAKERGLDVPGQVSIAGFDDSLISRVVWPQLTTICQPTYEMAKQATGVLLARIERREFTAETRLAHRLLIRASTAPARN
ncbi:LacI family DNA-binding transcriptional regulator [Sphingomonas baiyangensis]|uniref:LacI family DNA-binding transcriptional regulator n=1 Tax=Sphingomonas baiyangensis TaxID=2572576 RepID=A0A4V5PYR1_9SPHN|nr:LacI family DNA-binding transcriptional regulator [Sphingomonas baiyangensis]TKD52068.1 LacI family DNA-binding transcriptional regulator [Sphingomonas baiyangensis]